MQMAVIEYARHVCALEGAHSSELDPSTKYPVIDIMPEQVAVTSKGGTMRLGAYPCVLSEDSRASVPFMARMRSANVTATVMNSTTNTAIRSPAPACA